MAVMLWQHVGPIMWSAPLIILVRPTQLGGITERPDFQCHLDSAGEYEYHDRHDYPSAAAIADVLNENRIIPIFAVENNVRGVYDQLREVIRSAFVTTRTANSANLLETVVSQYQVSDHMTDT